MRIGGARLVVMLVTAGGLLCSASAAGAGPVRSGGRAKVIVDDGFRPGRNGFTFANYGNSPGVPNLGPDEMRQLFGDGVCAGLLAGRCVLSPPALAWMQQENEQMADGHCVGLSITALFFFFHLSTPLRFGAAAVPGLKVSANQLLAREIAYAYVFQALDSVRRAEVSGPPRKVLQTLITALRTRRELYTLGITQPDGSGGHAVTPYEVERVGPGKYAVLVYDNNYPRTSGTVLINSQSDTWSFRASPTPNVPAALYTGNASTHSLLLLPTRPGLGIQPCPFCSSRIPTPVATARHARRAALAYETVDLQMSGTASGHLLITDPRGRHVGFVHGHLVDEIPGANTVRQFVSAPRTWLEHTEPEYRLPTGQRYRIQLTGAKPARRSRHSVQRASAAVDVLEPGFVAAVHGIEISPGQHDQISLPPDGHAISFLPQGGGRQAPLLVLGAAQQGEKGRQWNIADLGTSSGEQISASLDLRRGTMSLTGTGSYDVSMDLLGNGVSVFGHNDLGIGTGITVNIDYTNWSAGDTMPITDAENGVIVGQQTLADQSSTDTGSEFAPTEPTPAPVEPQPQPMSSRATTTTLTCAPELLPVDASTRCTVDVSPASSESTATPTGSVDFSSDGTGSFSSASCTLSSGSCEVTYTPIEIGSGTHDLTASYRGDSTFDPSDNAIAIEVDPRNTATSIDCSPTEVQVGDTTTCTATVTDTDSGTPSSPTGTVTFQSSDSTGTYDQNPCTLSPVPGRGDSSSCSVTYTPSAEGSQTVDISASYSGDPTHASS